MKTLQESIAAAMSSQDTAIVPFLPYILQDFWEIGTPSGIVINFVKKHCKNYSNLNVLDLGCGKGAASVKLAAALKCRCCAIDAIPEFIETAKEKAREYGVDALCKFEAGDIREKINALGSFDVIILGGIGQVFGNYRQTLTILSRHLTAEGIIINNDAYIEDSSAFQYPEILRRGELLNQTRQAGMELIDECGEAPESYAEEFANLQKRCEELTEKYPDKTALFKNYMQAQADEYYALENEITGSIMVFKRRK